MKWFYAEQGQQVGPVDDAELNRLVQEGRIKPDTMVWTEGMPGWQPFHQARPAAPSIPPLPPGGAQCVSCGNVFPQSDLITIQGRQVCGACKPAFVQAMQEGAVLPSQQGVRDGPPWEQRATLGFFPSLIATVKGALTQPDQMFARMKREGGLGSPLLYKVMLATFGQVFGILFGVLLNAMNMSEILSEMRKNNVDIPLIATGAGIAILIAGLIVLVPLGVMVWSFIWSGLIHLSLKMVGGANQPFETTFRVSCYAEGSAHLLQAIPVCGGIISLVWGIVSSCIGLAKAHETSTGKAVAAVLIPYVFCCGMVIAFYAMIFGVIISTMHGRH